ncbi:MAG TPA: T9SS type A sorting domain-containing protein [Flavipsychrobacter sp.]|nr:T9SS type A sorting domain-containing protein [Flavipsychrobacter sp.]
MRLSAFCLLLFTSISFTNLKAQIITTVAGNGTASYCGDNGQATSACLHNPSGVTIDQNNNIYIADASNNRIRKIDGTGVITTVAGTGTAGYSGDGGAATAATLYSPRGVAVDFFGNLYIADELNHVIRKVDVNGIISTVAGNNTPGFSGDGGNAVLASLNGPTGIIVDFSGTLYIADQLNHRIRKVDFIGNIISTYAGNGTAGYTGDNGPATAASMNYPSGLCMDQNGNIFVADYYNNVIRRITFGGAQITTVAGDGQALYQGDGGLATLASLNFPYGVAIDAGDNIFIADQQNHCIRKVDPAGIITTVAGNGTLGFSGDGGLATLAMLAGPSGVGVLGSGDLYVADVNNQRIRMVTNCPIPTQPDPIVGSQYFCPGSQDTFSIPQVNNATSYVWTLPNGWTGSSTTESIIVTPGSAGGTITVYGVNSCGNGPSESITVSLMPVPTATASGSLTFCTGGSVNLLATPASGVDYQWLQNNTPIPGATSASFQTTAAGSYSVEISLGSCVDTSNTLIVAVNTPPVAGMTASGPLTFCEGDSVVFTASPVTGVTYQWLLNNSPIAGANSGTYAALNSGQYSVRVTANSCSDTSAQSTVTVNSLPTATITQNGNTLSVPTGFVSYQWYLNGNPISGATSSTYNFTQNGNYYVIISDGTCSGQSNTLIPVSVHTVGGEAAGLSIYPNPNNGSFVLTGNLNENATIVITDVLGRKVFEKSISGNRGNINEQISTDAKSGPGAYILQVKCADRVYSMPFLKQ